MSASLSPVPQKRHRKAVELVSAVGAYMEKTAIEQHVNSKPRVKEF